ncbi:MAG: efflux RND transporter permease subunit [Myxococcota bacterium]
MTCSRWRDERVRRRAESSGDAQTALFAFVPICFLGIVINNAIVLLDQIDIEQASGKSPYDAIVAASLGRFRPILMTTLTTVLGMLPIIISRDPLFYPMANTIAYGLAFGTVLTLGVAPVLYAVLFRVESPT